MQLVNAEIFRHDQLIVRLALGGIFHKNIFDRIFRQSEISGDGSEGILSGFLDDFFDQAFGHVALIVYIRQRLGKIFTAVPALKLLATDFDTGRFFLMANVHKQNRFITSAANIWRTAVFAGDGGNIIPRVNAAVMFVGLDVGDRPVREAKKHI